MRNDRTDPISFDELERLADDDAPGRDELLAAVRSRYHRTVTRRRYYALGSVTAAVLLVAGTATALSPSRATTPSEPQQVAASPTPRTITASTPATSTSGTARSTSRSSLPASATGRPVRPSTPDLGTQAALPGITVVDAITLTGPGRINWDLRSNVEYVYAAGPNGTDGKDAEISVFSPSSGFTAARVQGYQQQSINGHPAWFGPVSTWPTNGRIDPGSGKQDSANPSLTWQLPNGWWLVLQSSAASPTDPAPLLRLVNTLHISTKTTPSRVPMRLGYVPSGFASDNTAARWTEAGQSAKLLQSGLTLTRGAAQILVTVSAPTVAPSDPGTTDQIFRRRTVDGYVIAAAGTGGVSATEVQKVLDGVQVAGDPSQENSGWPTIGRVEAGS